MQEQHEMGKWVTDGKHTYPYNAFLDALVANGTLKFCDKPDPKPAALMPKVRSPISMTMDERTALATKLGVSVGDVGNMSPQELAEAEADVAAGKINAGFPA